ncbi:hypothetical protein ACZ87_00006 [Candidatus Erwinia dacicola]|uniref:Uncharacterized protein n=1 Tax=Candidatus Erwinia dacicola TaxID=252393 RepID=A0A328TU50_9GAMM|nr:hypothetical protein ACZ87_00006 [Candidatus Erwinia dacicola]
MIPPFFLPDSAEILLPVAFLPAEFSYPHLTARELPIRLQPLLLQSASRTDFKVRGFL